LLRFPAHTKDTLVEEIQISICLSVVFNFSKKQTPNRILLRTLGGKVLGIIGDD